MIGTVLGLAVVLPALAEAQEVSHATTSWERSTPYHAGDGTNASETCRSLAIGHVLRGALLRDTRRDRLRDPGNGGGGGRGPHVRADHGGRRLVLGMERLWPAWRRDHRELDHCG